MKPRGPRQLTRRRRAGWVTSMLLSIAFTSATAAIEPEVVGRETLTAPEPTWLLARDGLGPLYLFDSANGRMHGLLGISPYTPAVEPDLAAGKIYAAETFYSRGTHGERTDVVTIYDYATLSPEAEIEVPKKIAALPFRRYIALMDDARHVTVFNLTPAQSVSVVDIKAKTFVEEISTPGCALTLAVAERGFAQICGDGRLQVIRLDSKGREAERTRSRVFFDLDEDPVFDKAVPTRNGWLLASYGGQVFHAQVQGDEVTITRPWSLLSEDEPVWRPGGGQFMDYHHGMDLLVVLMNDEGSYAHDSAGKEIWIFKLAEQRRIARIKMEYAAGDIFISQTDAPLITVSAEDFQLHVFDLETLTEVRQIPQVGVAPGYLQGF